MARSLEVAALQIPAHDVEQFGTAWPAIRDRVAAAASTGAQLLVLPEGTIPAYVLAGKRYDEQLAERALGELRALAAQERVVIVCGISREHGGLRFNSAVVVDNDGSLAGYADKTFLWHFDRRWFAPSERIAPIATSLGPLGALVCADGRIPTIARALVDAGALILVMPTAWVTSGRDPMNLENIQADLLAQVRARENDVPFAAANKSGTERGYVAYCGKSQIVAADGSIKAMASQYDPETIRASLELRPPAPHRAPASETPERAPRIQPLRVAFSPFVAPADSAEICAILEVDALLAPGASDAFEKLTRAAPAAYVRDDARIHDPAGLIALRRGGIQIVVWETTAKNAAWNERFARARALELRIYVIVLDRAQERAYAIDPDGALIAGTFGTYRIASCSINLERTLQTTVAPGSEILDGLDRAEKAAAAGNRGA
jgi:predicted amidohydrolase